VISIASLDVLNGTDERAKMKREALFGIGRQHHAQHSELVASFSVLRMIETTTTDTFERSESQNLNVYL
jgi:hypothetical protein